MSSSFSQNYQEARAKFVVEASRAGGRLEKIRYPVDGPDGKALFTDVAEFGAASAPKQLVLISATHGIEGFGGSGAQIDLLRRGELAQLPSDTCLLMIHAINPYGFAWIRRGTHENIDLNRNWIDFSQPLPDNRHYDTLSTVLCPREWTDSSRAETAAQIEAFVEREGLAALNQAIAGGQFRHPQGLFYGGQAPAFARLTQTRILEHYCRGKERVGIVDFHTGLGPWGFGEQISSFARDTPDYARAACWFGAALKSNKDGSAASARMTGEGLPAAVSLLAPSEVTPIALEFGVRERHEVRLALRADAWLHAYGAPLSPEAKPIKDALLRCNYDFSEAWKGMVAGQSLLAYRQALAGLAL